MTTTTQTEQPYRIGTDSRPEWKVRAKTRGPIRDRTLTVKVQTGTAPLYEPEDAHRIAAEQLARKISGPDATVQRASSDGTGSRFDWRVFA